VSEGACFYFQVANDRSSTVRIELQYSEDFTFAGLDLVEGGLSWSGPEQDGCGGTSTFVHCYMLMHLGLSSESTVILHFQAPTVNDKEYQHYIVKFTIYEQGNDSDWELVNFRIVVMDLEFLEGNIDGFPKLGTIKEMRQKYVELWKDCAALSNELTYENVKLKGELELAKLKRDGILAGGIFLVLGGVIVGLSLAEMGQKVER